MSDRIDQIAAHAAAVAPSMIELRRAMHRMPEIGWHEVGSTARVAEALRGAGLSPRVRADGAGLTVDIGPDEPRVGFRADLDALPIEEENDVAYRSEVPGTMHACGHDAHTAVAAGIALVLSRLDALPGAVRVFFQPAEELVPGGAAVLRAEGVHRGLAALIAFHVDPSKPAGSIGSRVGAITSASDRLHVVLTGPGGHTSRPDQTVDLVRVAAKVVDALPERLHQAVGFDQTLVVAFGKIAGGGAENVIPTRLSFSGTVRILDAAAWRELPGLVPATVRSLAGPLGAGVDVVYQQGAPPVMNDEGVVRAAEEAFAEALGPGAVVETHQSMGAEDFAWFLEDVPGAMFRLGTMLPDRQVDLHSSTFDIDERTIEVGIRAGAAAIVHLLEQR
jgi:amidohydrolase